MDKETFLRKYSYIIDSPSYQSQKAFIQHGKTTVFDHELSVGMLCQDYLERHHMECDDLVIAGLLHDYFLYDWHDKKKYPRKGLHGFCHAKLAAENAQRDFHISTRAALMIRSHMFPMNLFTAWPRSKMAWALWHFDNMATLMEMKKRRALRRAERGI